METLHIRAKQSTMQAIMDVINTISKEGQEIEVLDNIVFNEEQKMIFQALIEEKNGLTYDHDKLWDELLN